MTDVTASRITTRELRTSNLPMRALIIGRGIGRVIKAFGMGLVDLSVAYARAAELAYVKSAHACVQGQRLALDDDLDGRDPNW